MIQVFGRRLEPHYPPGTVMQPLLGSFAAIGDPIVERPVVVKEIDSRDGAEAGARSNDEVRGFEILVTPGQRLVETDVTWMNPLARLVPIPAEVNEVWTIHTKHEVPTITLVLSYGPRDAPLQKVRTRRDGAHPQHCEHRPSLAQPHSNLLPFDAAFRDAAAWLGLASRIPAAGHEHENPPASRENQMTCPR